VAFSPGENFEPACPQFVRFNFATSMPLLEQILERVVGAVKSPERLESLSYAAK